MHEHYIHFAAHCRLKMHSGMSGVQFPIKDCVLPKTLKKMVPVVPPV